MKNTWEKGFMTLLITCVLLAIILVVGLSSYKVLFYQIKTAQNEVKIRQAHWRSEAGIECVYAHIHSFPEKLSVLSSASNTLLDDVCKHRLDLQSLYVEPLKGERYVIHANSATYQIHRRFHYRKVSGIGAIQSSADLRFIGSIDITPDAPKLSTSDGKYPCVAVRYLSKVTFEAGGSAGQLKTSAPMPDGPFSGFRGECAADYQTLIFDDQTTSITPNRFKSDYVKDKDLDTFRNYFNLEKSAGNIELVKRQYHVVSLATVADGYNCADVINTYLTQASNKLWIEGHCIITTPLNITWPSSLVVENGLFAALGSNVFYGSFYHLVDMTLLNFTESSLSEHWQEVSFQSSIQPWLGNKTIYFDSGSFHPKGGMYFDAKGGEVVLKGSYNLDYSSDNNPIHGRKAFAWQKGGWFVQ